MTVETLHLSVAHLLVDQAIELECVLGSEVIGFLKRKKEKLPPYFNELPVLHTSSKSATPGQLKIEVGQVQVLKVNFTFFNFFP